MTQIQGGKLGYSITEIEMVRDEFKKQDSPQEAELFYQVKQLLGELNQYLSGGYLSPDYIEEKCDSIKRRAVEIWEVKFNG